MVLRGGLVTRLLSRGEAWEEGGMICEGDIWDGWMDGSDGEMEE